MRKQIDVEVSQNILSILAQKHESQCYIDLNAATTEKRRKKKKNERYINEIINNGQWEYENMNFMFVVRLLQISLPGFVLLFLQFSTSHSICTSEHVSNIHISSLIAIHTA